MREVVRIARVCPKPDCGYRQFFLDEKTADRWRCPDHHQAVVQENRPYRPGRVPDDFKG